MPVLRNREVYSNVSTAMQQLEVDWGDEDKEMSDVDDASLDKSNDVGSEEDHKFEESLDDIVKVKEELISAYLSTISTQADTILTMKVKNTVYPCKPATDDGLENHLDEDKQEPMQEGLDIDQKPMQEGVDIDKKPAWLLDESFANRGVVQKTEDTVSHNQALNGKVWIFKTVGTIDKLVKKYALPLVKRKNVKIRKGKRRGIVPRYFASIWRKRRSSMEAKESVL